MIIPPPMRPPARPIITPRTSGFERTNLKPVDDVAATSATAETRLIAPALALVEPQPRDEQRRHEERERVDPDRQDRLAGGTDRGSGCRRATSRRRRGSRRRPRRAGTCRTRRRARASSPTRAGRDPSRRSGTVASLAGPHISVSISMQERDDDEPEQVVPERQDQRAAPARPMSQVTITVLRFQRSRNTPPIGASTKPGSMRATITRPIPVPDPTPCRRSRGSRRARSSRPGSTRTARRRAAGIPGVRNTRHGAGGIGSWSGADGMNGACWSLTRRSA